MKEGTKEDTKEEERKRREEVASLGLASRVGLFGGRLGLDGLILQCPCNESRLF